MRERDRGKERQVEIKRERQVEIKRERQRERVKNNEKKSEEMTRNKKLWAERK